MDQLKDKGFVVMMFIVLIGSIGYAYWHFVIDKNYTLVYHADCDPTMEVCYVWECDPEAIDEEEKCTGDPDEDIWYYTHMERLAKNVPACTTDDEKCDAFVCKKNERGCREVKCTEEMAKIDEVTCSDPDTYNMAHPEEMEESDEEMMKEDEESANVGEEGVMGENEIDGMEMEMSEGDDNMVEEIEGNNEIEGVVAPKDVGVDT